eukprot:COSAG05_NODE_171_length_15032_cov_41.734561_7_plen_254_part_00
MSEHPYSQSRTRAFFSARPINIISCPESGWRAKQSELELVSTSTPTSTAITLQCPGSHTLNQWLTPRDQFGTCDSCHASAATGTTMFGCRECNFDLCQQCYDAKSVQGQPQEQDVTITITGAGHSRTNGTYKYHEMHNGKPAFQKQGGDGRIYVKGGCWVTNEDSNYTYWEYVACGNSPLPPSGTWPKHGDGVNSLNEPDRAKDPRPVVSVIGAASSTPSPSGGGRPAVGDRVRLQQGWDSCGDAADGPLAPG